MRRPVWYTYVLLRRVSDTQGRFTLTHHRKVWGGVKVDDGVHSSSSFFFGIVPPPPPTETILQHNHWFAHAVRVRQYDYKYILEGLFLRNPRAFSTEKNPATNKVHYSIKSLKVENPPKFLRCSQHSSLRKKYVLYGKSLLYLNQK